MIGTFGGTDQYGLPEIFSGYPESTYSEADCVYGLFTYHCRNIASPSPASPAAQNHPGQHRLLHPHRHGPDHAPETASCGPTSAIPHPELFRRGAEPLPASHTRRRMPEEPRLPLAPRRWLDCLYRRTHACINLRLSMPLVRGRHHRLIVPSHWAHRSCCAGIGLRQHAGFDFRHRHHRQIPAEKQEQTSRTTQTEPIQRQHFNIAREITSASSTAGNPATGSATMITNRSNHIPTFTKGADDHRHAPRDSCRNHLNQKTCGMIALQENVIHPAQRMLPNSRFRKWNLSNGESE